MSQQDPRRDKSRELPAEKQALLALRKLRARVEELEYARREPIAVVGLGCRFPGGADSPEAYWRLLRDGVDAVVEVPRDRWDVEEYFDPDPQAAGKTYSKWGGFLDRVYGFDADFFGISPREALRMDPQQRLFLEVVWEALEHAGIPPAALKESKSGVFAGTTTTDYMQLHSRWLPDDEIDAYLMPGNTIHATAGRVAYFLGLHGPAITMDTACSSSLVAIDRACRSLRDGECNLAIAGGVNLMLAPQAFICFSRWGMMARDGRCKTFDAAADGFVRGEGCGVVILKRLSDARADGDRILALVRGSAVNQDGASSGLSVPNGLAQQEVIRAALSNAGLRGADVSYVEAHGTGTALGDPIEVEALGAVLGSERDGDNPLAIGSVKTNLGHLEAASGVAGFIKVVLALQHGEIPPHLHLDRPSTHIPWDQLPIVVPTRLQPWTAHGARRAGVSAFGFSGTNVHVVLEEAPVPVPGEAACDRPRHLLALSARSEDALRALAGMTRQHLESHPGESWPDVCYTANAGRTHFSHRLSVVAPDPAEAGIQLAGFLAGEDAEGVHYSRIEPGRRPRVAFMFTGQGSQYPGMARELLDTSPTFRAAFERCDAILEPLLGKSLQSIIFPEPGQEDLLDQTCHTQPALFAVEYSLSELWRSWGVEPTWVIGHSLGEYVAACVAGVFSLEDGLRLVAERARLMQALPPGGRMVALRASESRVRSAVAPYRRTVSVAAVNGPESIVVSGEAADVQAVLESLAQEGVESTDLKVSHAFHSPLMEAILEPFEAAVAGIQLHRPKLRLVSNLTGRPVDPEEIVRPDYWLRHVREPVSFAAGVRWLREAGCEAFLELGPTPVLLGMARQCVEDESVLWLPALRPGRNDWSESLASLRAMYHAGVVVDWLGFDRDYPRQLVNLPTYPFQRKTYALPRKDRTTRTAMPGRLHPCLDHRVASPSLEDVVFETRVSAAAQPFLADHRVLDRIVFPATAYLESVRAAAELGLDGGPWSVDGVAISSPLGLEDTEVRLMQFVLSRIDAQTASFRVFSAATDTSPSMEDWKLHASGMLRCAPGSPATETVDIRSLQRDGEACQVGTLYAEYLQRGVALGPRFQGVSQAWRGGNKFLGLIEAPQVLRDELEGFGIHPAVLDACTQIIGFSLSAEAGEPALRMPMPIGLESFRLLEPAGDRLWAEAVIAPGDTRGETIRADFRLADDHGRLVAELLGMSFKRSDRATLERTLYGGVENWLHELKWQPIASEPDESTPLPEPASVADSLAGTRAMLESSSGLDRMDALRPRLDRACAAYIRAALADLGCDMTAGSEFDVAALASQLQVVPGQRQCFQRCLEILAEDGWIEIEANTGRWQSMPDQVDPDAEMDRLVEEFESFEPLLAVTRCCGTQLAEVMAGKADPLQLLFPAGDLAGVESLQRKSPSQVAFNALAAEAVRAAVQDWPANRPLRVLEVGAGTGATTMEVLRVLPEDRARYTFTDVSPLFLARAKEKFSDRPSMDFRLFDVEREPVSQGFETGSFDIVIASNVLHATQDLRETLGQLHQVLAEGGWLLMLEAVRPQRWIDLSYGLTEGWWKFRDRELRSGSPLLSRPKWRRLLLDNGFDAVIVDPPGADEQGESQDQAMILARKAVPESLAKEGRAQGRGARRFVVFADRGGVGAALAQRLQAAGDDCEVVFARSAEPPDGGDARMLDPDSAAELDTFIANACGAGAGTAVEVIYLWPLDARGLGDLDAAGLLREQASWCGGALHLAQALVRHATAPTPRLWLCTQGVRQVGPNDGEPSAVAATVWGLGHVVALEHPELQCTRMDLPEGDVISAVEGLMTALHHGPTPSGQLAWRDDALWRPRLERIAADKVHTADEPGRLLTQPYRLSFTGRGSLDNLRLERAERVRPGTGEVEIRVHASALNFRDVLNVMGMYPGDPGLPGGECAGTVVAVGEEVSDLAPGDEVIALPQAGGFSAYVTTRAEWVVPKPARLSFDEAVTFPSAFLTAYYTLVHLARLGAGDRVLIHSAAGGVGLAAVMLARRAGAEIFATAGSPAKRAFLESLGVQHVMDSRSFDFARQVMDLTSGRGVDVVLNSLADRFVDHSLDVTAAGGRFVEIGKRGIWEPERVAALGRDIEYHVVDLAAELRQAPASIAGMLRRLVSAVERHELEPLPYRVFGIRAARDAFRFMARGRHIGKIVISHRESLETIDDSLGVNIRGDATYLVTGGLGGLGLLSAQRLVERGARHLVLTGRRAAGIAAQAVLDELASAGVEVRVAQVDASDEAAMIALMKEVRATMPPLRGVIHSAGVLDDGALMQQSWVRFAPVFAPKVVGSFLLDRLTKSDELDFFVLFSSLTGAFGTPGQGNHAAANAFMDSLAAQRRASGRPGLSINWGAWSGTGAAADRGITARTRETGFGVISPQGGLLALEEAMVSGRSQVIVLPADWQKLRAHAAKTGRVAALLVDFAERLDTTAPRPATSARADAAVPAPSGQPRKAAKLVERMAAVAPNQRRGVLVEQLRKDAGRVLGLDSLGALSNKAPLSELGLDSLMAVELRNVIGAELGRTLPATLLFDYPTIDALADYLGKSLLGLEPSARVPGKSRQGAGTGADLLDRLEGLDDEEIDRLVRGEGT